MEKWEREFKIFELLEEVKEYERFERFYKSIPNVRYGLKTEKSHLPSIYITTSDAKIKKGAGKMIDIEQTIKKIEKEQGRSITDKEREVIEGFGMIMESLWDIRDPEHKIKSEQHRQRSGYVMSKSGRETMKYIISKLSDKELIESLEYHLQNAIGVMPENIRLMAIEVLKRWQIRMP